MTEEQRANARPLTDADREDYMSRALEVLNNRIDQFGLTEPSIRAAGRRPDHRRDPRHLRPRGRAPVHHGQGPPDLPHRRHRHPREGQGVRAVQQHACCSTRRATCATRRCSSCCPRARCCAACSRRTPTASTSSRATRCCARRSVSTARTSATPRCRANNLTGQPTVNFVLTSEGGEIFYKLTSANVGKVLAVVLDNKIKAQATIRDSIRDQVQVEGFEAEEARDLALVLRTGSLPVPLRDHQPAGHRRLPRRGRHPAGHQREPARARPRDRLHDALLPPGGPRTRSSRRSSTCTSWSRSCRRSTSP